MQGISVEVPRAGGIKGIKEIKKIILHFRSRLCPSERERFKFSGNAIATGEVGCDGSGEQSLQACGNPFGPQRPPAGLLSSGWPEAVGASSPSYLSSYVRTHSLDQTSSRDRIGPGPEMIC